MHHANCLDAILWRLSNEYRQQDFEVQTRKRVHRDVFHACEISSA